MEKIKEYEMLLNEYEELKKEINNIYNDYIREFGDDLNNLLRAEIDVIALKKTINYCNRLLNKGEKIYKGSLDKYIDREMLAKRNELFVNEAQKKNIDSMKGISISAFEYEKIKKLYRKIARLIHPDLHPELAKDEEAIDLFHRLSFYYRCNDLPELENLYDYIILKYTNEQIDIVNIDEKMEILKDKIQEIIESEEYQYKEILSSLERTEALHFSLKNQIESALRYKGELEIEVEKFNIIDESVRKC